MFKLFPALNLIVLFFALNVQSEVETEKTLIASDDVPVNSTEVISKTSDYIFDTPDVVKEYTREDGTRVIFFDILLVYVPNIYNLGIRGKYSSKN